MSNGSSIQALYQTPDLRRYGKLIGVTFEAMDVIASRDDPIP